MAGGEPSGSTAQKIRGVAGVGGATRWESIGLELPRRRPAERQPDVGPILNPYAVLYPGMTHRLDFSSYQAVSDSSAIVLETISLPIEERPICP